jgi:hypothetical protein
MDSSEYSRPPIKARVNGKIVSVPVFSSDLSAAFLSGGFKTLDPSLPFHCSISGVSPGEAEEKFHRFASWSAVAVIPLSD